MQKSVKIVQDLGCTTILLVCEIGIQYGIISTILVSDSKKKNRCQKSKENSIFAPREHFFAVTPRHDQNKM